MWGTPWGPTPSPLVENCCNVDTDWSLMLDRFVLNAEPVCAVGQGVSALCCATEGQKWIFNGYSLTGVSVSDLLFMHMGM